MKPTLLGPCNAHSTPQPHPERANRLIPASESVQRLAGINSGTTALGGGAYIVKLGLTTEF